MTRQPISKWTKSSTPAAIWLIPFAHSGVESYAVSFADLQKNFGREGTCFYFGGGIDGFDFSVDSQTGVYFGGPNLKFEDSQGIVLQANSTEMLKSEKANMLFSGVNSNHFFQSNDVTIWSESISNILNAGSISLNSVIFTDDGSSFLLKGIEVLTVDQLPAALSNYSLEFVFDDGTNSNTVTLDFKQEADVGSSLKASLFQIDFPYFLSQNYAYTIDLSSDCLSAEITGRVGFIGHYIKGNQGGIVDFLTGL